MEQERKHEKRLIWGVLFMITGALILIYNLEIIPWRIERYLFTWQMLIVGVGLVSFLVKKNKIGGIILMALGGYLLIEEYNFLPYDFEKFFWPGILVLIGLTIIIQRDRFDEWSCRRKRKDNSLDE